MKNFCTGLTYPVFFLDTGKVYSFSRFSLLAVNAFHISWYISSPRFSTSISRHLSALQGTWSHSTPMSEKVEDKKA